MSVADKEFDLPDVLAEVRAAFAAYEAALMANDIPALNAFFWVDERAVRFGPAEALYGHAAIAANRAARDVSDLARRLENTRITALGPDHAMTNTEYVREKSGRRGRQSQVWVRTPAGWRVVAGHVSLL